MKINLSLILIISLFTVSNLTKAQIVSEVNTGRLFRETKNSEAYGTPYLFDEWKLGSVTLNNGTTIDNVKLKFDILNNTFLYNQHDSTFEFLDDVRQIAIKDPGEKNNNKPLIFEKVINANDKIPSGTFVQILSTGKVNLMKYYLKKIEGENYSNGMFTTKKEIVSHNTYWATFNKETVILKFSRHSLDELTSTKTDQVDAYIKSNKLNIKNEQDFAAAINFYNSISSK